MAFLFNKFQEVVNTLAKSPTFARFAKDPRQLQFEIDINRLFLLTSYNRLGRNVEDADVEEIIEIASKSSVADQQKQVQENIHSQIENFCTSMDEILLPDIKKRNELGEALAQADPVPRRSGLSFAVGKSASPTNCPAITVTRSLKGGEVSSRLKDLIGYTLNLKPSQIHHKEAGQGLFVHGEADVGSVIALYPGVIYTPAYYQYIPGYPKVDACNPYLVTRYDATVINAQPWGVGGETRELWNGLVVPNIRSNVQSGEKGLDRVWKMLSKPVEATQAGSTAEVLEWRNPLALAHFANHPAKGMDPNVMICPYDFPLTEKHMRTYIPNIAFGDYREVNMRRFGSFWFRSKAKNSGSDIPILKTIVLVATRNLSNEEVLLNYRLSHSKRRPKWYTPVDEEEDQRRWS